MSNHVHCIVGTKGKNLSEIVRDFKRHTSKQILNSIIYEPESRREWMLKLFEEAAKKHSRNNVYQFWTQENHIIELHDANNKMIDSKLDYIHNNPVRAGLVVNDHDYLYSSAEDYTDVKGLVNIEKLL